MVKTYTLAWLFCQHTLTHNICMAIQDNLKREMRACNTITQYELEKRSGVPQTTIQRILSGKTKNPKMATINKLAAALEINTNRLMEEEHLIREDRVLYSKAPGISLNTDNTQTASQKIPLLTKQQIIELGSARLNSSTANETNEFVATPSAVSHKAYAYIMQDPSMNSPSEGIVIPLGHTIVIDPDETVKNGRIIVVKDKQNNLLIKKLLIDGPNTYLTSINTQFSPILLTTEHTILGVAVDVFRRLI